MSSVEKKITAADITRARDIEAMMNTAGWKHLEALLSNHVNQRTQNIFDPTPEGGVMASEHKKGVVWGLLFARDLPRNIVAATKDARTAAPNAEEGAAE